MSQSPSRCCIWWLEGTVPLAARPFNSFNTEENRAPLANRVAENSAVNLDCGGKWTDRSGGVSSVCEQRCMSVDTPQHSYVPSNLVEKTPAKVLLKLHQITPACRECNRKCPKLHLRNCKHYFRLPSDIREHLLYAYLFKYSWKESRNSVAGLWFTPAISLCQRKSRQYPPANMQRQEQMRVPFK